MYRVGLLEKALSKVGDVNPDYSLYRLRRRSTRDLNASALDSATLVPTLRMISEERAGNIVKRRLLVDPPLPFFLEKKPGTSEKSKDFSLRGPLKSLEKKGKKPQESKSKKKTQGLEGEGLRARNSN